MWSVGKVGILSQPGLKVYTSSTYEEIDTPAPHSPHTENFEKKKPLTKFWRLMSKIHKKKTYLGKKTSSFLDVEDDDS